MKAFAAAVVLLAFSAGAANANIQRQAASLRTDVKGLVQRGPVKNTCSPEAPCSAPAPGVILQAFKAGNLVAKTTTNVHGRFSFSLARGYYTIRALGRGTKPKSIHVQVSKTVRLRFLIDTGIR